MKTSVCSASPRRCPRAPSSRSWPIAGDVKLFAFLDELGFDYVIRFRGNIHVAAADGETRLAADWVGKGGRARKIPAASVTAGGREVGAVVCVHAKDMKEAWCLATSHAEASARQIITSYAKRWTIEPGFRDTKDLRFGMGMGVCESRTPNGATGCFSSTPSRSFS